MSYKNNRSLNLELPMLSNEKRIKPSISMKTMPTMKSKNPFRKNEIYKSQTSKITKRHIMKNMRLITR